MKRKGYLYEKIHSIPNLYLAERNARKGKEDQYGIKVFDRDRDGNILRLNGMLENKTYATSTYTTYPIWEPKKRIVFCLPYFPDRIVHHAIMIPMEPIFVSTFTCDTYSCIKKRGIHAAYYAVRKALNDEAATKYCLKLDVKQFYPTVDHYILKRLLRKKIKDTNLLWLLDGIIESAEGLPIGNYLSQFFANFYLTYFDHWLKEKLRVPYYFRYLDDMVLLNGSKQYLHKMLYEIKSYLRNELNLTVKENYQVFPVESRGIDFVGYKTFHDYALLRKGIKQNFARAVANGADDSTIMSYWGWLKHCNSINLIRTLNAQIQ